MNKPKNFKTSIPETKPLSYQSLIGQLLRDIERLQLVLEDLDTTKPKQE